MPKAPKRKNKRNPLRVLRELLSEKGKDGPMTQKDLAQLISVSVNTIKAVEAGQRNKHNLSSNIVYQVAGATGALWNYREKQWMSMEENTPFTFDSFSKFRRQRVGPPSDRMEEATQVSQLESKLGQLFRFVDGSRWWELRFRCERFLEDCWFEFQIEKSPKYQALLARSAPKRVS